MESEQAVAILGALAHETRLAVFRTLVRAGEPVPAGALLHEVDVPATTLSFHLKALKEAGVVSCRREGRSLLYAADMSTMGGLLRFLTEDCCRGLTKK
ncbi:MAG: metalloregulator ArsR/SmtB family transcription factor [Deltaproteobacteria bacterium]|nr:metalloregulator ArsR/SmtB family transcription factor [Deltaproteobacteria bacterium]